MNPGNFFAELKRRNVYRAAVAYGVVAWFLQLTTHVFPFFEIPNAANFMSAPAFPRPKFCEWRHSLPRLSWARIEIAA